MPAASMTCCNLRQGAETRRLLRPAVSGFWLSRRHARPLLLRVRLDDRHPPNALNYLLYGQEPLTAYLHD